MIGIPGFYLLKREVQRFMRVIGQTILSPIINAFLYLFIFGVSIGNHVEMGFKVSYLVFLIPGLIMMGVLNNAYQNAASSIMISKYHGDLEDLKVTPLTPFQIVWAMSAASLLRGLLVGTMIGITGQLFIYIQEGAFFPVAHPLQALFFLSMGGLAFGQIGICVGFVAKTFDHMNSFGAFILLPLIYLGGVFFSLDLLHPVWKSISLGNPLLYYINGFRAATIEQGDLPLSLCATAGLCFLATSSLFAYLAVKKGVYQRF